jgi:hypothetical protein
MWCINPVQIEKIKFNLAANFWIVPTQNDNLGDIFPKLTAQLKFPKI